MKLLKEINSLLVLLALLIFSFSMLANARAPGMEQQNEVLPDGVEATQSFNLKN